MSFTDDAWTNAVATIAGQGAFIRRNVSLMDADRRSHPVVLIISLFFKSFGEDGLPNDDEELTRADMTEEAIAKEFERAHDAWFGLVVMSDASRDVFLFLPNRLPDGVIEAGIMRTEPRVDFDFDAVVDPEWQPYFRFGGHGSDSDWN